MGIIALRFFWGLLFFSISINQCTEQGPIDRIGDTLIVGTVSFSQHIKPMFDAYCAGCHVQVSGGGLNTSTYAKLMAGGDSGLLVIAGNPDASLLLKRLNGNIPPQMPPGDLPFTTNQITNIIHWIEQGAMDN